jgi:hypothetical protein
VSEAGPGPASYGLARLGAAWLALAWHGKVNGGGADSPPCFIRPLLGQQPPPVLAQFLLAVRVELLRHGREQVY